MCSSDLVLPDPRDARDGVSVADLRAHGERTDDQYMRIMCPVNVRTENQKGALGNQVSAIFPTLPAWPMNAATRHGAVCAVA